MWYHVYINKRRASKETTKMRIMVANPKTNPEICEVSSMDEINLIVKNFDADKVLSSRPDQDTCRSISNGIHLYCNKLASFNLNMEDNLWAPGDSDLLCGTVVFAGYDPNAIDTFGVCSLSDLQMQKVLEYITLQRA